MPKYGYNMENMDIETKYGKIWKIWILKPILEASNQAKNAFFVRFRPSPYQEKNMDFHIFDSPSYDFIIM